MRLALTLAVFSICAPMPALAATDREGADLSCDLWGTEAFFSAADPAATSRCLETRDPNMVGEGDDPAWFAAASHSNSPEVLRLLIEAGADLNAPCVHGNTTGLVAAARDNDNPAVLDLLIEAGADPTWRNDGLGLVHWAATNANVAVLRVLHARGVDLVGRGDRLTPLHVAARYNENAEAVRFLLASGSDPEAVDAGGSTPLHLAASFNANAAVVETLIDASADVSAPNDRGVTPLHLAAESGNAAVVAALIAADADVSARNRWGGTPLAAAAKGSDDPAVLEALVAADADPGARSNGGRTLLHFAAGNPNIDVLRFLLASGADPKARDDDGHGPLFYAIGNTETEVFETLVASGADVDAVDKRGTPVLFYALVAADPDAVGILLAAGADAGIRDPRNRTALHNAMYHFEGAVPLLLRHGADPNARTDHDTILHEAALYAEDPVTVETLVAAGADVNARGRDGITPLHLAQNVAIAAALLSGGATVDARTSSGATPLHWAARRDARPVIVEYLAATGARLEARDEDGQTPLHWAATEPRSGTTAALIALGANIDARDEAGNTPLLLAVQWKSHDFDAWTRAVADGRMTREEYQERIADNPMHAGEAVTALLAAGADATARNAEGRTAWDLTQENEALRTADAYWLVNEARFSEREAPPTASRPSAAPATAPRAPTRACEIPGYPALDDADGLGLPWCPASVGFQRRAFALQAAAAWCAIAVGSSASPDQVQARQREIGAACDMLDATQSPGAPTCRCPTGYRP
ncbi:MAG: ankyrin repeat domain-containing protein [Gammaproteobacteria bacterium]|nr:ankyrin repeat domain-containing protein [Gammaproteobacteria bacterium]